MISEVDSDWVQCSSARDDTDFCLFSFAYREADDDLHHFAAMVDYVKGL